MSTEDGHFEDNRSKQPIQRACDVCRRRKSKCDGLRLPGSRCLTCIDANLECTYNDSARKRITQSRYVADLEKRLQDSQTCIRKLREQIVQLHAELDSARSENRSVYSRASSSDAHASAPKSDAVGSNATLHILRAALKTLVSPPNPSAGDLADTGLEQKIAALRMDAPYFVGKSSGAALVDALLSVKDDVNREVQPTTSGQLSSGINAMWGVPFRRPEYWLAKPWKKLKDNPAPINPYTFPEPELAQHLIDLYFTRAHIYLPVLHRQTFERNVAKGVYLWDNSFAATMLLVCAIGSRYSDDLRVLAAHRDQPGGHLLCGWEWFNQVPPAGRHLFGQATLYDLQYCCLAVHFLMGATAPQASYMLVGVGLRLAQDVGAHRRAAHSDRPSVESEQWKRAFWVLVYMDSYFAMNLGRTCAIQYDDFDAEPLIECDDEYWEHPTHPFQQPRGVPSRIAFFNSLIRLTHILAFTLKILYSLNKSRTILTADEGWEEQFVADLDSALNRWREELPEHLTWDPARKDRLFFDQSVALNCAFCGLQILIHRSFIPIVCDAPKTTRLPSLEVCTSAARLCAGMVDAQRRRTGDEPVTFNTNVVFNAALVLVLNVWVGKRRGVVAGAGTTPDPSRDIAYVLKSIEVLRLCEKRWQHAGILCDTLSELVSFGQLSLGDTDDGQGQGRSPTHDFVPSPEVVSPDATAPSQPMAGDDLLRYIFKSSMPATAHPFDAMDFERNTGDATALIGADDTMNFTDRDNMLSMWSNLSAPFLGEDWIPETGSFSA